MSFQHHSLLIFDLDGTLIDSVPDLAAAVNHMLLTLHRQTFDENVIRFWVGNGAQTLVRRALCGSHVIDQDLDQEVFEQALEVFLTYYKSHLSINTVLYPQVRDTLQQLKAAGFRISIVTNKPFEFVQPILEGLGIAQYFEFCLGGDSLATKKPDPLPLLHTCKVLGVNTKDAVMIGDSKNDILAAKAAGIKSIAVSYGYNYGEDISIYNPDIVIDDFSEILGILKEI